MRCIDALYLERSYSGSRRMTVALGAEGHEVNRKRVQRLMRIMGQEGMAPGPHTRRPHAEHPIYPYLLLGLAIERADQVWASDITSPCRWSTAGRTWWPSWIGTAARCWPGDCRTRWAPTSALRRWRRPCATTGRRTSSTQTRARSSPTGTGWGLERYEVRIRMDGTAHPIWLRPEPFRATPSRHRDGVRRMERGAQAQDSANAVPLRTENRSAAGTVSRAAVRARPVSWRSQATS